MVIKRKKGSIIKAPLIFYKGDDIEERVESAIKILNDSSLEPISLNVALPLQEKEKPEFNDAGKAVVEVIFSELVLIKK